MSKQAKREIRRSVICILEVCLFLGVSTWFWYGPREKLKKETERAKEAYVDISGIELKDKKGISLANNNKEGSYFFTLKNNTNEEKEVRVVLATDNNKVAEDDCKMLASNNLNYYLHQDSEQDHIKRTLSLSGNILLTTLKPQEERHYTLEYFLEEDIDLTKNHYHAKAVLASGKNKI